MNISQEIIKDELVYKRYISNDDHVIEVKPFVCIYEAHHQEKKRGWAVGLIADDNEEKFLSFCFTEREAKNIASKMLERLDFPIFALLNGETLRPVQRVRGVVMDDEYALSLDHESSFNSLKNLKKYNSL